MSGGGGVGPEAGARGVPSLEAYERRLRSAMWQVDRATRNSVVREVVAGVDAQVKVAGGDFSRVAEGLDDPRWVGRQMVKVYGAALWVKLLSVAVAALLAFASVPGLTAESSPDGAAGALALLAFAVLVVAVFWAAAALSPKVATIAGAAGAGVRVVRFVLPQGDTSPLQAASGGEVALFLVATLLLVVVGLVPGVVGRARRLEED